jgi:hypothetical protein
MSMSYFITNMDNRSIVDGKTGNIIAKATSKANTDKVVRALIVMESVNRRAKS